MKSISEIQWTPEEIQDVNSIPKGDMPGDKVMIGENHIEKAKVIFPKLLELLISILNKNPYQRAVVAVCGGSGVGKSEIASLLSYYLNKIDLGSYTLSGDNYPHRIPKYNDAERLRIFEESGIEGLKNYLGSDKEIDFNKLSEIISQFKNGSSKISLKRMGREETELWYDNVDFSDKNVLVIEWTHGNSFNLQGVDIPILLNSTPQETLEHRKSRNRDGGTDSPFTSMVLSIEQEMLISQAYRAKLIISKDNEIISYNKYIEIMK